jgi:hypothetical protein
VTYFRSELASSVGVREATYVSTPSHHYPRGAVPLSAKAYRPVGVIARTLLTASLMLMVTGCAWHSSQEDFGSYYASVTHPRYERQTLISSPERHRWASVNHRHHQSHQHHDWAAINRRRPLLVPHASLDCQLRPHPDLCRYSPAQSRSIGSNSLAGNGESSGTSDASAVKTSAESGKSARSRYGGINAAN